MTGRSVRTYAFAVVILLVGLSVPVPQGGSYPAKVTCTNKGEVVETIFAHAIAPPDLGVYPPPIFQWDLEPGASAVATFEVVVPRNAEPGTRYTVTIVCESLKGYIKGDRPIDTYSVEIVVTQVGSEAWGGCLIATAAYGSELSPEVQLLRNFRERDVLSTFAGSQFMNVFNSFYYSFSPHFARVISTNNGLRTMMRYVLYPLIGILWMSQGIYGTLAFNPEAAVVAAGLFAAGMIGLVYALPFTFGVCLPVWRVTGRRLTQTHVAIAVAVLGIALGLLLISELTGLALLLQFSTSLVVLAAVAFPGIAFSAWAVGKLNSSP